MRTYVGLATASALLLIAGFVNAHDHGEESDPIKERQGLMEDTKNAAGPVGKMMRGDMDFDAEQFIASMDVFISVASRYGDLFPEGSEFGHGTEAAPAIWSDRAGFNAALDKWMAAAKAAKAGAPESLNEARPLAGPVFQTCKGCHDDYRIDD